MESPSEVPSEVRMKSKPDDPSVWILSRVDIVQLS